MELKFGLSPSHLLFVVMFLLIAGCAGVEQDIEQTFNEDGSSTLTMERTYSIALMLDSYADVINRESNDVNVIDGFFYVENLLLCKFLDESGYQCSTDEYNPTIRVKANVSTGYSVLHETDPLSGKEKMKVRVAFVELLSNISMTKDEYLSEVHEAVSQYVSEKGLNRSFCIKGNSYYSDFTCRDVELLENGSFKAVLPDSFLYRAIGAWYGCIPEPEYNPPRAFLFEKYNTMEEAKQDLRNWGLEVELKPLNLSNIDNYEVVFDCGDAPFTAIVLREDLAFPNSLIHGTKFDFLRYSIVPISYILEKPFPKAISSSGIEGIPDTTSITHALIPSYPFVSETYPGKTYRILDFVSLRVSGVPFEFYRSKDLGYVKQLDPSYWFLIDKVRNFLENYLEYLRPSDVFDFRYVARLPEGYKITSVRSGRMDLTRFASANVFVLKAEDAYLLDGVIEIEAEKEIYPLPLAFPLLLFVGVVAFILILRKS